MLQYYCGEALGLIRDPADDSVASLATVMNEVADYQCLEIARQLLDRVFGGQPVPSTIRADKLTDNQRTVLSAIAASKKLWHSLDGGVLVISTIDLMKHFALPLNVMHLRSFLEGRLTPRDAEWAARLLKRELTPEQQKE